MREGMILENKMVNDGEFREYARQRGIPEEQVEEILDLIHRREDSSFDRGVFHGRRLGTAVNGRS
jgi:hypothetical protein